MSDPHGGRKPGWKRDWGALARTFVLAVLVWLLMWSCKQVLFP